MNTLREAAQAILDRWDSPKWEWHQGPTADLMADLRAALAQEQAEPVATDPPAEFVEWVTREIPPGTIIGSPEWWAPRLWRAALRSIPPQRKPEPAEPVQDYGMQEWEVRALRAGWAPAPPQRKPLTDEEIRTLALATDDAGGSVIEFARAVERAHGIE